MSSRSIRWPSWASAPRSRASTGVAPPAWAAPPGSSPPPTGGSRCRWRGPTTWRWCRPGSSSTGRPTTRGGRSARRLTRTFVGRGGRAGSSARPAGRACSARPTGRRRAAPTRATSLVGAARPAPRSAETVVVELGSLWAGPLCGSLLRQRPARTVVKVESTERPDGARRGPSRVLRPPQRRQAIDRRSTSSTADGRAGARATARAGRRGDRGIAASRPRAARHRRRRDRLGGGGPRSWLSITGHGRREPERDWVAFGDDAAVAGGLVVHDERGPVFCADAIADPITGVVAAGAVLEALREGGRWLVDVALSAVAASLAGPTLPVDRAGRASRRRTRVAGSGGVARGSASTAPSSAAEPLSEGSGRSPARRPWPPPLRRARRRTAPGSRWRR